jgi:hypothetical protein
MNPILREYKGLIAAVTASVLGMGGSAWFFWSRYEAQEKALQTLKSKSSEITRFRNALPPPTQENAVISQRELKKVDETVAALRSAVLGNDAFPLSSISPQDFQKILNDKAQALFERSKKESVVIPFPEGESSGESYFYLSFKEFKSKPPSPEKAPVLHRQLLLTELILNLLLDKHPQSIAKVRLFDHDPAPVVPPPKPSSSKKDSKPEPPLPAPSLNAQTFEVHFSGSVETLRDYLNAITSQKQAFFVVRSLKVTNSKEKEPPLKESEEQRSARVKDDKEKGRPERPMDVVGSETVSVELILESLTVPPVTDAQTKDAPKK